MRSSSLAALFMCFVSSSVFAQWDLVNEESSVTYVSIKKSKVGENNSFTKIKGKINDTGEVEVSIDLSSVETNIEIRNKRMKEILFNTARFAEATISGSVNLTRANNLEVGKAYTDSINLNLSLHGVSNKVNSTVIIIKLSDERLFITSLSPVLVNAGDYGLSEGVEKLRNIAKLPSISSVVPVTFSLTFKN